MQLMRNFIERMAMLLSTLLLSSVICSLSAFAHQTGNSYLTLREADGRLWVELDFIVRDLGNLLQVPGQPSDPPPAPDKLASLQVPITQVIQQSLSIAVDEQDIPLEFMAQSVVVHNDGLYVRQRFSAEALSADAKFVLVRYQFFTQNDMLGRAFFKLSLRGEEISSVFDQSNAIQRFALGEHKRWSTMGLFTQEGAKHIWEGPDHLLFLLTLLLPGLMLIRPADTSIASGSSTAWKFALKVITAFTVAHSITLACSVLGWVSLPDRFIESMIALSIMVSAASNLQNRFTFSHWKMAFVFGLIHGMGFANGLKELGLSSMYFLEALFAFNLGVELGQLSAVALVAVPLVLLARREESRLQVMRWGSGIVFLIALVWLVQRLFG
jgi:hypothetical protein